MKHKNKTKTMAIGAAVLTIAFAVITDLEINVWWKATLTAAILTICFALGQWFSK